MRRILRKIYWRIGVVFLRMAGLQIPEESFKHQLVPVSLDYNFIFPAGGDAVLANKLLRQGEQNIMDLAKPYIHVEHTNKGEEIKVRMKLIIQRYENKKPNL